jgi:hypothetical protein
MVAEQREGGGGGGGGRGIEKCEKKQRTGFDDVDDLEGGGVVAAGKLHDRFTSCVEEQVVRPIIGCNFEGDAGDCTFVEHEIAAKRVVFEGHLHDLLHARALAVHFQSAVSQAGGGLKNVTL